MRTKQVILQPNSVLCPCCGYLLLVGATVRLKAKKELGQDSMDDYPVKDEGQEAGDGA